MIGTEKNKWQVILDGLLELTQRAVASGNAEDIRYRIDALNKFIATALNASSLGW